MQASVRQRRLAPPSPISGPRYILVTQCLQNDFFRNIDCRLGLPGFVALEMLVGRRDHEGGQPDVRKLSKSDLEAGPLGQLLEATIGRRARGLEPKGSLHVINVRDWHCEGTSYDDERRVYGRHCEQGTWGAAYIDGLAHYLDPNGSPQHEEARYFAAGSVRIYHVHSDTLFDFKPREQTTRRRKFSASELEDLLDMLVEGSDSELEELHELMVKKPTPKDLHERAVEVLRTREERHHVYLGVIGVYTDIKVKTLLTGVRTRYDVENIAVSDTFTTSPTLERHLAGLDYAKKVLSIEVIHGINDFVRFLGSSYQVEDEKSLVAAERYASYQLFFQDQQNVLAYQNQRLQEYLRLTEHRAVRLYDTINRANRFLLFWGSAFLLSSLVLGVLSAVWDRIDWKVSAVTGGLGLAQLVGVFFTRPTSDLQRNLTNLAGFKMVLESHALKTAIMRFHLTTARTLRPIENKGHAEAARRQIDILAQQLAVIGAADAADFAHLAALGFEVPAAKASAGPAENGGRAAEGPETTPASDLSDRASRAAGR